MKNSLVLPLVSCSSAVQKFKTSSSLHVTLWERWKCCGSSDNTFTIVTVWCQCCQWFPVLETESTHFFGFVGTQRLCGDSIKLVMLTYADHFFLAGSLLKHSHERICPFLFGETLIKWCTNFQVSLALQWIFFGGGGREERSRSPSSTLHLKPLNHGFRKKVKSFFLCSLDTSPIFWSGISRLSQPIPKEELNVISNHFASDRNPGLLVI